MSSDDGRAVELAREAFDAASRSPAGSLQVMLAAWQGRNFGAAPLSHMALGAAEEIGELCHAVLKSEQRIRGMENAEAFRRAAGDAIADATIYLMQAATVLRLDWGTLVYETARRVMERDFVAAPADGLVP